MAISDILSPDRIRLDLVASSKKKTLEALSELLVPADTGLTSRSVCESLMARERLGSTGLGHGVALPHGRVDGLEEAAGALVRVGGGVDFDAPDGKPVDLVFGLIVPTECTDQHLQILAELARAFSEEARREAVREAATVDAAFSALRDANPDD